jgi:tetratricopeptide (TPR) repeat protein
MKSSHQAYKTFFPKVGIDNTISQVKGNLGFWFAVASLTYVCFFVPLSYASPTMIKAIWNATINVLWLALFLLGTLRLVNTFFQRPQDALSSLGFEVGKWIFLGIFLILSALGLVPITPFITGPIAFSMLFILMSVEVIEILFLRYRTYLAKSMHFVQQGASLYIVLGMLNILFRVRLIAPLISSFSLDRLPILFFQILGVVLTVYLINLAHSYVIEIRNNTKERFYSDIIKVIVVTFAIEVLRLLAYGAVDFLWLANATFLASIFYVAQNPTKRKSSRPVYVLTLIYILFLVFNALGLDFLSVVPITKLQWGNSVVDFSTILSNLVMPLTLIASIAASVFVAIKSRMHWAESRKVGETKITERDVTDACNDIVQFDGPTLTAVNTIMSIVAISKRFRPAKRKLNEQKRRMEKGKHPHLDLDVYRYFSIYLLCVEFALKGSVRIEAEDEESGNQQNREINSEEEFSNYVQREFPKRIMRQDVWSSYENNPYIQKFISLPQIQSIKPISIFDQIRSTLFLGLQIFVMTIFVLSTVPAIAFGSIPAIGQQVIFWNNVRLTDLRLKFSEVFEPYASSGVEPYYANRIFYWADEWKNLHKETIDFVPYWSADDINQTIHWYELLLGFHIQRDNVYYWTHLRLGDLYKALGQCDSGIMHFTEALQGIKEDDTRDFLLESNATCYLAKKETDKAIEILSAIVNEPNYYNSKILLAETYISRTEADKVIRIFQSANLDKAPTKARLLLGVAYYQINDFNKSRVLLEKVLGTTEYNSDGMTKTWTNTYLGDLYYRNQDYFKSAEFIYNGLSAGLMHNEHVAMSDENRILEDFKVATDEVFRSNGGDFRVNLWYCVYYIYAKDRDKATEFFAKHVRANSGYEKEFTQYLLTRAQTQ